MGIGLVHGILIWVGEILFTYATESGTVYVLRSYSEDSYVKEHREVLHKMGVTGGDINKRFANAKNDPTFSMAEVEVVASYSLANINRVKLEPENTY